MFYETKLDENTWVLLDSESSGAFAKNETETKMSPAAALQNSLDVALNMGRALSSKLAVDIDPRMALDLQFGIKCDGQGNVMISSKPDGGQFAVTLRWTPYVYSP